MDVEMPEMDGYEATRKIREFESDDNKGNCRIITVTAHDGDERRRLALDSGMNYFLSKPVKLEQITTAFKELNILCESRSKSQSESQRKQS